MTITSVVRRVLLVGEGLSGVGGADNAVEDDQVVAEPGGQVERASRQDTLAFAAGEGGVVAVREGAAAAACHRLGHGRVVIDLSVGRPQGAADGRSTVGLPPPLGPTSPTMSPTPPDAARRIGVRSRVMRRWSTVRAVRMPSGSSPGW
jgi:hypothetical protein